MNMRSSVLCLSFILLLTVTSCFAQNAATSFDMDEAARQVVQFTTVRAGAEAWEAYRMFMEAQDKGDVENAEKHYRRAVNLKAAFIGREAQRLKSLYASAVAAYDAEDHRNAEQQFQELNSLPEHAAGYQEAILPVAEDIARYLDETKQQLSTLFHKTRKGKVIVWLSGAFHTSAANLGLSAPNQPAGSSRTATLPRSDFIGMDFGTGILLTPSLLLGGSWSSMVRPSEVNFRFIQAANVGLLGGQGSVPFDGASIHSFSVFVQPGHYISRQTRLYGQGGISLVRITLPDLAVGTLTGNASEVKETAPGFLIGGGADIWQIRAGNIGWGVRFDIKYHYVNTGENAPGNQKVKLNGFRVGGGILLSLGSGD